MREREGEREREGGRREREMGDEKTGTYMYMYIHLCTNTCTCSYHVQHTLHNIFMHVKISIRLSYYILCSVPELSFIEPQGLTSDHIKELTEEVEKLAKENVGEVRRKTERERLG